MKLIVIDSNVTRKSPSMRAWVEAFPHIADLFDKIEIWASNCDIPESDKVSWKRIPQRFPTWKLHSIDYTRRVAKLARSYGISDNVLMQVTGCLTDKADIRYMHFWNLALLEESSKRTKSMKTGFINSLLIKAAARQESRVTAAPGNTGTWWVVSRSLADKIAQETHQGKFRILPNQYDSNRFHPGVRNEWRKRMREHYGFAKDEQILVFSAFGHFERKGLKQGIEAVEILRRRGHAVRYLILGGTPSTILTFKKQLTQEQLSGCLFAGTVETIEHHLAAADGLLFPSHFEAFSLAEIEAAALGIRLYLTPHYGSEMILRPPTNGQYLPWDPQGMADVIEEDLKSGIFSQIHSELGEAITAGAFQAKLRLMYGEAIQSKATA